MQFESVRRSQNAIDENVRQTREICAGNKAKQRKVKVMKRARRRRALRPLGAISYCSIFVFGKTGRTGILEARQIPSQRSAPSGLCSRCRGTFFVRHTPGHLLWPFRANSRRTARGNPHVSVRRNRNVSRGDSAWATGTEKDRLHSDGPFPHKNQGKKSKEEKIIRDISRLTGEVVVKPSSRSLTIS